MPFDGNRAINYMPSYRVYVQDQWQASRKFTVSAGVGWNYFPIGHRPTRGLEEFNFQTDQVELCGVGGQSPELQLQRQKGLFSPTLGLAFRPTNSSWFAPAYSLASILKLRL